MSSSDSSILSRKILSDITVYAKYAKFIPPSKRRETWEEAVFRNMAMHIKKFPTLEDEIIKAFIYVLDKKVLPSMRSIQFGGLPMEINNARGYNCAYASIDNIDVFSEAMFLLLSGCGFSYSVQKHHIEKLPELVGPAKRRRNYLIGDSIIGWADAIKMLINAYFKGKSDPIFDYRDIRPKGSLLITSGGKAPGPGPLKDCIHNIRKILDNALSERGVGTKLKPIEAHDIMCYIADAVLSGGIRRAACLAGFSFDDEEMLASKTPEELEKNPQRHRANNSVVLLKRKLDKVSFDKIFDLIKQSKAGEPGIIITNDKDYLFNPCGEASLKSEEFCNLTTINGSTIENQEDFNNRARIASFIGTLQASYTDFHYLRDSWRRNSERDALLGVSITGIASKRLMDLDYTQAAKVVLEENERVAKLIGINKAARTTLLKPEGTTSLVLGCSSGIHGWHSDDYYIRRIRLNKDESLYKYINQKIPELLEDDYFKPNSISVLSMPVKVPEGAITRNESAIDLINRCIKISKDWIKPGHRAGANTHNVSATITVREHEWEEVREHVWNNINNINGMTFYRYDGNVYVQPPFETCSEEVYNQMISKVKDIDIRDIIEDEDNTQLVDQAACSSGGCTITHV